MDEFKIAMISGDLGELVNQIVERLDPRKIILFGSYASGTPGADSDVDLLVVTPDRPGWREAQEVQTELQQSFPLPLQVVFIDADEFEETQNVVGGLAYPACHEGKLLYEKNP
jgi:predicted nucleotidyltransferase